ncbi:MAG: GDP-L-fucose synthase [Deltaproteobacteria bacterium]|nr:GDP-L-fucose synthase [Deltaproteobacteria bacterium]
MEAADRIFVAGHRGLLGRALVRRLEAGGYENLLKVPRGDVDLTRQADVEALFRRERPAYVFLAAGRVGGIVANQKSPADFIVENLAIQTAVLSAAHEVGVEGLCFFGSSCMYPRDLERIREDDLGTGVIEPTSRAYATAKIAGVELCRAYHAQYGRRFFTLIPATLYGAYDHFGSDRAHVIPALIERFHAAAERGAPSVSVLGTGRAKREFSFVDDAADAAVFCMQSGADLDLLNAGSGEEVSISDLAGRIARVVGYAGEIRFDTGATDGAPRKLLDSSRLRELGWHPQTSLDRGIEATHAWYVENPGTS